MLPSEIPRLVTGPPVRVFHGVWKLLSFLTLPFQDGSPSLPLLSLFLSFIFCPTSFQRQLAGFLGAWCPLPAFRSFFFLWNLLSVQMFFWWIYGGESVLPVLFLHNLKTAPPRKNIKSSKGKTTSNIQGKTHMINSGSFIINSAGQKGMVRYIWSTEREKATTKVTLPSKDLIQNWWRNQKLYR